MPSGFQEEAKKRDMKKEFHKPFYNFLKNKDDGSWDVFKADLEEEGAKKHYEISALGQCSCKGYKYNNSCKHSEVVSQNKIWDEGVDEDYAEMMKEKVLTVYNFDEIEFDGYEYTENGKEIVVLNFTVIDEQFASDYERLMAKSEDSPVLINLELENP